MRPAPEKLETLFDDVVGHKTELSLLAQLAKAGTLPHALLFVGPAAVGKRRAARALAGELVSRGDPAVRRLVLLGNAPDIHLLSRDPEKRDISVEQVRELCSALSLRPYLGAASVAIIDEAERMSAGAANALLKTLEEPPSTAYLILISSAPHALPETILSRCQRFGFGALSNEEIAEVITWLVTSGSERPAGTENSGGESNETAERDQAAAPAVEFSAEVSHVRQLVGLCSGSLEVLQLSGLIDQRTMAPIDAKALGDKLRAAGSELARLTNLLKKADSNASPGALLSIAAELADDEENGELAMHALREHYRTKLSQVPAGEVNAVADTLLAAVRGEYLTRERNLNKGLVLANVMMQSTGGTAE